MKKTVELAVKLFVITAVVAAVLAFINSQTAPIIAERQLEQTQKAFGAVYPDAEFTAVEDESLLDENITQIVEANVNGQQEGYAFAVNSPSGYGGPVNFAVGVKNDGSVTGFEVLSHSETQGFGAAVTEPSYAEGVANVLLNSPVVANGSGGTEHEIPAITGATATTKAMESAFNMVVEKWAALTGNTVDMTDVPEVEEPEEVAKLEEVSEESLAAFIGADSVTAVADAPTDDIIQGVYEVTGGDVEGHLFHAVSPDGYAGSVEFVVGVAEDGAINYFTVVNHGETPGFGGAVEEPDYATTLTSSTIDAPETAISGATATSTAMQEAFEAVKAAYDGLK